MVPTTTGKPGKMAFFSQGKVREFYPKYWKNQKNYTEILKKKKKILEKSGKFISQ